MIEKKGVAMDARGKEQRRETRETGRASGAVGEAQAIMAAEI
jgi:hypothetical protein